MQKPGRKCNSGSPGCSKVTRASSPCGVQLWSVNCGSPIYEQAVVKGRTGGERDLFKHLFGVVAVRRQSLPPDASCHIIRCRPHSLERLLTVKSSGRGPAVDPVLPLAPITRSQCRLPVPIAVRACRPTPFFFLSRSSFSCSPAGGRSLPARSPRCASSRPSPPRAFGRPPRSRSCAGPRRRRRCGRTMP